ncbi:hypothetical protein [Leptospira mayottensis]|uniref:Uncharacterized protein n=2 Tax=Leptospira mayottensis TaxID=1137606 RepID=A0AA87MRU7_9LEPT|nr:hypothetical protein [Leptospira mayottensis]AXR62260.1 hypothetical protein DQM68_00610 [Leptospira mayottensis]AXR65976.1 hypothetical protein DQM28_02235 [Leptospira mayottensis]AZQ03658.1 hypothetical protein LEP1GSC190_03385 [Leptospira mayottensis 200901116]EKS01138.1 hypothetical protein LEP1GSC125_1166 [Leptospira mayottensis 200901122]TGN18085.1 hypothetical protein EHR03_00200 [Leptospira mayottensis]
MKRCRNKIGFPLTTYILAFSFLSISILSSSNFPGKFHPHNHKQTINGVESEYKEPVQLEEEFELLLSSLSLIHKNIPFVFKGKITSLQDRFQFHFCNIQTLNLSNLPPPSLV